ncbi:DNA repair protein RecN-like [Watersipora subatra]|uniref:DNA repair protein RecN-like n=1 Tax=Watersipora subatra TaxID=2589382 RepID=UPI00355C4C6A
MIPDLELLEQGQETPGVAEHVEETPDIGEHEEETSVVENRLVLENSFKKILCRFREKLDHGLEGCNFCGSSYRDIAAGIKRRVEEGNNRGPDSKLKKPSLSLPSVAKMDSFAEQMETEYVSTETTIRQRKAMMLHRRRQVEEQYKHALSAIKKDIRELEEEIKSEEYREALLHLSAVKQKRAQRRGARDASSVTITGKESKVEESKEEIQSETSVVRVVPSRDASFEKSKVEEPKKEVQPESSGKSGNDDQLAGSELEVQSGNNDQFAGSESKV